MIVDFPMPDATRRRRLWEHSLAPLPQRDDLDLDFCAEAFELSGGNIRSIAVTLGYRAAAASGPIDMADVDPRRRRGVPQARPAVPRGRVRAVLHALLRP